MVHNEEEIYEADLSLSVRACGHETLVKPMGWCIICLRFI